MDDLEPRTSRFPAVLLSARQARGLVTEQVAAWGLTDLLDSAALCASELAANAVLHTRQPFTATVRRTTVGVRIDVVDALPQLLPTLVPVGGSAADITRASTTGRGLQIVAAVAARWGAFASSTAKTVWAELDVEGGPDEPSEPEIQRAGVVGPVDAPVVRYQSLPVRAAVASGVQVDEVVRDLQLRDDGATNESGGGAVDALFALVDRTAPLRLAGRHAAFLAAGEGRARFDLDLAASDDDMAAVAELSGMLARSGETTGRVPALTAEVLAFRSWLAEEAMLQRQGAAPRVCPLPD